MRLGPALLGLVIAALAPIPQGIAQDEARSVYVGIYLHDVTSFDQKNGVFDVDFEMWVKWAGDFDPDHLGLANAASVDRQELGRDEEGGWHSARYRVRGTLRGEFPLAHFPFDEQTIAVGFDLPERYGRLVPDLASSGMSERFSLTDWLYEPEFSPSRTVVEYPSDLGNLDHEGESTRVDRVEFRVDLQRPIVTVALKLFLPLLIIMLIAFLSLFIAPEEVEARSAMGVTALLSCFAFQFTVSDALPEVAYLTLGDTFFLLAYVVTTLIVLETIIVYTLERKSRPRSAIRLDRVSRVVLPLASLILVLAVLPEPSVAEPIEAEPLGEFPRHATGRPVLRIGTNILSSIVGSVGSYATRWGLIHEDTGDGDQNLYLERIPGVDNELLRFEAGGAIEVTWRIREGSKWSDGEDLTTADVEFALSLEPDESLSEVRVIDAQTVVLRWSACFARALEAPWAMPAHVLRDVAETENADGDSGYDAVVSYRRQNPVPSLGAYRISEWESGERLILEANPHFPGAPPNIPRAEVLHFDDSAALRVAFEAGDIDMTMVNSVTVPDTFEVLERSPEVVNIRPSAIYVFLSPDLSHPLLGQLEVRRALLASLDRDAIGALAYPGGNSRVAHTCVPGEVPGVEETAFDTELAREELARLGVTSDPIPLFYRETGRGTPIVDGVVASFAAVGVTLVPTPAERTSRMWQDGGHGGLLLHIIRARRDADPRRYFQVPVEDGAYVDEARHDAYRDATARLVERELHTLYPERREQLRDTLFAEYSRSLPGLPILFAPERVLVDPALRDWQRSPEISFGRALEMIWFAERDD
ncbi:MAG: hypothetical protein ACI9KE_003040 [Polyangiales bacterium]|jgi:hypothetical protein